MSELRVFDVSPMVHVGSNGFNTSYYGYPVGGIQYTLNFIALAVVEHGAVSLCFDSPSFRVKLGGGSGYKSGREPNPAVFSQIETLYEELQACGIRCEKYTGYEADDIIEWVVAENYQKYGVTTIYTNDHDICHSIRPAVTLFNLHREGNNVDQYSFETGIERGKSIPYNTISAYKVFTGCKSDKIPPMKLQCGKSGEEVYRIWVEAVGKVAPLGNRACGPNPKMVELFCERSGLFSQEEMKEVKTRIKLVYPADKPNNVTITPTDWSEIDKDALVRVCTRYNAVKALSCMKVSRCQLSEQDKQMLREKGKTIVTGEYATDKNLPFNSLSVKTTVLNLQSFEKEF